MIISQTPLRVSLFGGGTDFSNFFLKEEGAVLSLGIDKYVYVIAKERFDEKIYVNYSKKEIVDTVEEVEHGLVREAMKKTGITGGIEVTTLADVPSQGSGLGSSSSITVGLLNAFYAYQGEQVSLERLASEACEIEIDILGKPIGCQDQYIAAYGNMRLIRFQRNGKINVEKLNVTEGQKRQLVSNLLLFYSGKTRSSSDILIEQKKNIVSRMNELRSLRDITYQAKECMMKGDIDKMGYLLNKSWVEKKKLASNITTDELEEVYQTALSNGAIGGKICGAGAGGFFLLYCPMERQESVRDALSCFRELPFLLSRGGTKIIFNMRSYEWK